MFIETLDKLYLEISTITKARNKREKLMDQALRDAWGYLEYPTEENIKGAKYVIDKVLKTIND